jgi:hypothetical protein
MIKEEFTVLAASKQENFITLRLEPVGAGIAQSTSVHQTDTERVMNQVVERMTASPGFPFKMPRPEAHIIIGVHEYEQLGKPAPGDNVILTLERPTQTDR